MSDTFIFAEYDEVSRPIVFKLRAGKVTIKAEYRENYMTQNVLDNFDKKQAEAEEKGGLADVHKVNAEHLSVALSKIEAYDMKDGKKVKLPDATPEDRYAILQRISFQDLRIMISQIATDMSRPFDTDETTLSDGQAPKAESETAPETKKAT